MPKAVFITPHYYGQKRRTGFFWVANALHTLGWEVLFFTSPVSLVSVLNRDNRLRYGVLKEKNRLIEKKTGFYSFVHYTHLHKVDLSRLTLGLGLCNGLLSYLADRQPLKLKDSLDFVQQASMLVFESSPSLELVPLFRNANQRARYVYRVSDDLEMLRVHPDTKEFERKNLLLFDRISCCSRAVCEKLRRQNASARIFTDFHGIEKQIFDQQHRSPYRGKAEKRVVFAGVGDVDYDFLNQAIKLFPTWEFHLIGPLKIIKAPNVIHYGELHFNETIPYIKFADIGLQCRSYTAGAEALADTLKVLQYTYCGLAIVAPNFLRTERNNTFYYAPHHRESIKNALEGAAAYDRQADNMEYYIPSWQEVAQKLLQ